MSRQNKLRSVSKDLTLVLAFQFLSFLGTIFGISFLTTRVYPSLYGDIGLLLTLVTLIQQVIFAPLALSVGRYFSLAERDLESEQFVASLVKLLLNRILIAFVLQVVCFVALRGFSVINIDYLSFLSLIGLGLSSGLVTVFEALSMAQKRRILSGISLVLGTAGRFWCAYLSSFLFSVCLTSIISAFAFCSLLAMLMHLKSQRIFNLRKSELWVSRLHDFSKAPSKWALFTWGQSAADRWALGVFTSQEIVGKFVGLQQIAYYPIQLAFGALSQFLVPYLLAIFNKESANRSRAYLDFYALAWAIVGLGGAVVALLFGELIQSALLPENYHLDNELIALFILSSSLFCSGQALSLLPVNGSLEIFQLPKVFTALLAILGFFLGSYFYGLKGVLLVHLSVSCLYFFVCYRVTRGFK
jgi:hypothetical protein